MKMPSRHFPRSLLDDIFPRSLKGPPSNCPKTFICLDEPGLLRMRGGYPAVGVGIESVLSSEKDTLRPDISGLHVFTKKTGISTKSIA